MRNKILILLIIAVSFVSAHDLWINHFSPNHTTAIQSNIKCNIDTKQDINLDTSHQIHHAMHFDALHSSHNIAFKYTAPQPIEYSLQEITTTPLHKLVRPPIV